MSTRPRNACAALFLVAALCASPRLAEAKIIRHRAPLIAFQHAHPCPSTDRTTGACPGYQKDHRVPLCFGGADEVWNLQWLSVAQHRAKTVLDDRACRDRRRAIAKT